MHTFIHSRLFHTSIHVYMHTYIHSYMYTLIHSDIHTCIHSYIYTFVHSYIHSGPLHTYISRYIHKYIHPHIRTIIPSYMHVHCMPNMSSPFHVCNGCLDHLFPSLVVLNFRIFLEFNFSTNTAYQISCSQMTT